MENEEIISLKIGNKKWEKIFFCSVEFQKTNKKYIVKAEASNDSIKRIFNKENEAEKMYRKILTNFRKYGDFKKIREF